MEFKFSKFYMLFEKRNQEIFLQHAIEASWTTYSADNVIF